MSLERLIDAENLGLGIGKGASTVESSCNPANFLRLSAFLVRAVPERFALLPCFCTSKKPSAIIDLVRNTFF